MHKRSYSFNLNFQLSVAINKCIHLYGFTLCLRYRSAAIIKPLHPQWAYCIEAKWYMRAYQGCLRLPYIISVNPLD